MRWARIAALAALFVVPVGYCAAVMLAARHLTDGDGYFHFRVATLIAGGQLAPAIDRLPFTVLGDRGVDHHWLFHVLIAPFGWLGDGAGMRTATIAAGAAPMIAVGLLLRGRGAPAPWAWVLGLLAVGWAFPFRMLLLRAPSLAVVWLMAFFSAAVRRRHAAVAAVAALAIASYHGAVLLLPLALLCAAVHAIRERRFEWRVPFYTAAGLLAGLVVNPGFPRNFEYLFFNLLFNLRNPAGLGVGLEHLPPSAGYVLGEFALVFAGAAALAALHVARPVRVAGDTAFAMACALASLAMMLRSGRFLEYFVPFSVVALGLALRDRPEMRGLVWTGARRAVAGLGAAALALLAAAGAAALVPAVDRRPPPDRLRTAVGWLSRNTAPDEIVVNLAWDDFPQLYFHGRRNRWVNGLDPNYLLFGDRKRFDLWAHLVATPALDPKASARVAGAFSARFLLVSREHRDRVLSPAPPVHRDRDADVYALAP